MTYADGKRHTALRRGRLQLTGNVSAQLLGVLAGLSPPLVPVPRGRTPPTPGSVAAAVAGPAKQLPGALRTAIPFRLTQRLQKHK